MAMQKKFKSIKDWDEADRPREKLMAQGKNALSNSELLAILLGSGNREKSAVELAKEILDSAQNNLNELGRLDINQLKKFKGIGEAKAITLMAAMELGRRRKTANPLSRPKVTCSKDAYDYISPKIADLPHEEFWILLLNRANKIIGEKRISEGSLSSSIADPKKVFKMALEQSVSAIILSHNHPSGNRKPSKEDIRLTKKLVEGGKILEIAVLDHIIVANQTYFSFADESYI